jgi:hypothetical protein
VAQFGQIGSDVIAPVIAPYYFAILAKGINGIQFTDWIRPE